MLKLPSKGNVPLDFLSAQRDDVMKLKINMAIPPPLDWHEGGSIPLLCKQGAQVGSGMPQMALKCFLIGSGFLTSPNLFICKMDTEQNHKCLSTLSVQCVAWCFEHKIVFKRVLFIGDKVGRFGAHLAAPFKPTGASPAGKSTVIK